MKKIWSGLLIVLLLVSVSGCGNESGETSPVRVLALKGPTGMGLVNLMDNPNYVFTITDSAANGAAALLAGETDLACVPTNMASILYQKSEGKIQCLAINTLGTLYLVGKKDNNISSIKDLEGKTLYCVGEKSTPEYVVSHILEKNQVQADFVFKAENEELASLMSLGEVEYAILPEPFVTATLMKNGDYEVKLDLTQEWKKVEGTSASLCMGVLVGNKDYVEKHQDVIQGLLDEYKESVAFVNSSPEEAGTKIEEKEIFKAAVAQKAIPNCHIVFMEGEEMKNGVESFLSILFEKDPSTIGGKIPGEDFYYAR